MHVAAIFARIYFLRIDDAAVLMARFMAVCIVCKKRRSEDCGGARTAERGKRDGGVSWAGHADAQSNDAREGRESMHHATRAWR
jgi:hypothetical protein